MMSFSALALMIDAWMISAKGIKPNDKTVSVYSLSMYNFDQNKSFNKEYSIGWTYLVLLVLEVLKTQPRRGTDGKK